MRKFKSLLTVLAITVTSAALFTGCGNTGSNDVTAVHSYRLNRSRRSILVTITTYDASGNEVEQTFRESTRKNCNE